ncbi:MAG: beta-lactamase family protein [Chloroflexota bacterium]|nr:beta-lactamase family protein [Chloroflexota bacterium]
MMRPENISPGCNTCPLDRRALLMAAAGGIAATSLGPFMHQAAAAQAEATPPAATLDQVLSTGLKQGMPGIALAVEQKGDLVFSGAAGVASIEQETPLKATDRFRIYSITKTFTATIVLQLVDEGMLTLDDTVAMWLDQPDVARIPNLEQATIRQVLNHTSGIYDFADDDDSPFWEDAFLGPTADWTKVWTLPELLAYADEANHAPYFAPGEACHYSNTNYLLLGMIIEKATGSDFGCELQARILTPLGLNDTALATGGAIPEGVVDGYQLLDNQLVNVSTINLSWVWAAGGIVSTTADLLRFARAMFTGELLSPESFEEMFTFVPSGNPNLMFGGGLYQEVTPNGKLVGMDGGSAGFNSTMMWLPDEEVTVVLLTNRAPGDGSDEALRNDAFTWTLAH